MQQKFNSEWLTIHPGDRPKGQVYLVIGQLDGPCSLEGWLNFPPGSKRAKVTVCFDDEENFIEGI